MRPALARLAAAATLTVAALTVGAAPAAALPDLIPDVDVCGSRTAPFPSFPSTGAIGGIAPAPETPPTGDPFTPGGPALVDVYGHGGKFSTYDLGCGQDVRIDAADAKIGNRVASAGMGLTRTATSLLHRVATHAYDPAWLAVLDAPVARISAAMRDALWNPLGGVVLTIGLLVVASRLHRAHLSAGIALLLSALAAATIVYVTSTTPTKVTGIVDGVIPEAAHSVSDRMATGAGIGATRDPAAAAVAPLVDLTYRQWLAGALGCSDCPAAERWGPRLYDAAHMTYAEEAEYIADPQGRGQEIVDAKAEEWNTTATEVRDDDPRAYRSLTGGNDDRTAAGWAAALTVVLPAAFTLLSLMLVIAAFLIWRLIVATGPFLALFGLIPATAKALPAAGLMLAASVINSLAFIVVAHVEIAMVTEIAGPDSTLNWAWSAAIVIAITVILWLLAAPARRLVALATADPVTATRVGLGNTARGAKRLAGMAAASFVGNKAAMATENDDDDPADDPERSGRRWHVPGSPQGPLRYSMPVQDRTLDDVYREGYHRMPAPRDPAPGHPDDLRPDTVPGQAAPVPAGLALPAGDAADAYDVDAPRHARVNLDADALPAPTAPRALGGPRVSDEAAAEDYDPRTSRRAVSAEEYDPATGAVFAAADGQPLEGRIVDDSDAVTADPARLADDGGWVIYDPDGGGYRVDTGTGATGTGATGEQ